MPILEQEITPGRLWGLWKIEETEAWLSQDVKQVETIPDTITHLLKRLEFFAGRKLTQELLRAVDLDFFGISKDEYGKPSLKNHPHEISLSHSYPYVTVLIDKHKPVGIDLEQVKPKLLKIAARVLHAEEYRDAGNNPTKHCVYWCAKEALLKVYGKKNLTFAENLRVGPFSLENEGKLTGRIIVGGIETTLTLQYRIMNDFVMVYNT
jgi:4'-phosphopantetheinyl transferase